MKNSRKTFCVTIVTFFISSQFLFAQCPGVDQTGSGPSANKYEGKYWCRSGNSGVTNNIFGTMYAAPINVFTGGVWIAQFTNGNGMGTGDGLKIRNPSFPGFDLDMWADNGSTNGTHIKWDGSGLIQGATTRFD